MKSKVMNHIAVLSIPMSLFACSDQKTQYGAVGLLSVKAQRIAGTTNGTFDANPTLGHDDDNTFQSQGEEVTVGESGAGSSDATAGLPKKQNLENGSESGDDVLDAKLMQACLNEMKSDGIAQSFKLVELSGENANNGTLFEDPAVGEPSAVLLRLSYKNVNNSSLKLLNPKSIYCIDMRVKNMNSFKFEISCEAKVGFVRLERKNSNQMSTTVREVKCE